MWYARRGYGSANRDSVIFLLAISLSTYQTTTLLWLLMEDDNIGLHAFSTEQGDKNLVPLQLPSG